MDCFATAGTRSLYGLSPSTLANQSLADTVRTYGKWGWLNDYFAVAWISFWKKASCRLRVFMDERLCTK